MHKQTLVWACALAILAATASRPAPVLAQSPRLLSDAERQLAFQLEDASVRQLRTAPVSPLLQKGLPQLGKTPAGRVQKSVVTDVTLLGSPGTSAPADRQALVTRYEYS